MPGEKPEIIIIVNSLSRITGSPEVISSPVELVPTNPLVLNGLANFRVVGYPELIVGHAAKSL